MAKRAHPLKLWRKAQRPWYSQEWAAHLAGVPTWALGRLERGGSIPDDYRMALARLTGLYAELGVREQKRIARRRSESGAAA